MSEHSCLQTLTCSPTPNFLGYFENLVPHVKGKHPSGHLIHFSTWVQEAITLVLHFRQERCQQSFIPRRYRWQTAYMTDFLLIPVYYCHQRQWAFSSPTSGKKSYHLYISLFNFSHFLFFLFFFFLAQNYETHWKGSWNSQILDEAGEWKRFSQSNVCRTFYTLKCNSKSFTALLLSLQ